MEDLLKFANAILSITPMRWENLTLVVPLELLSMPPAPGEWSALECLQHLVDTEPVFQFRIGAFLRGMDFPDFDPDSQGNKPEVHLAPEEIAQEFKRLRAVSLEALAGLDPDDLPRQAIHQEFGRVTLSEMLHEWAAHDLMHTVQAERAMMQPFIQASGPWQSYFKDHVA